MAGRDETQPDPEGNGEDADDQGGVFGNLPGTRPGFRSPRRGEQPRAGDKPKPTVPRAARGASSAREPARPEAEPATPPAAGTEHGGVEDLAWAGIAVAAEAATLGVRLLSRAVDAVRKPPERR
jgi:hypothetical protein